MSSTQVKGWRSVAAAARPIEFVPAAALI